MKNCTFHILLFLSVFFLNSSCSIFEKTASRKQSFLPSNTAIVSQFLIKELLASEWMQAHHDQYDTRPIIMVGNLHKMGKINRELITIHERELAKNSQFRVIRAYYDREILDKQIATNPSLSKTFTYRWAKSQGADFILLGGLNSPPILKSSTQEKQQILHLSLISINQQKSVWEGYHAIE